MLRPAFLSLALGLLAALPLRAGDVSTFTLENGLRVVVIEDHRAPAMVHMVWYPVGAADEPAGKSGIAHFLEHLMFKGTDAFGPGELSKLVEAQGGSDNAFTSWDYTAYFQRVAADRLGLMMQLEADRMRGLRLAPDDVKTEREVILEERAQRTDTSPGALFSEQRRAAQYLNHPYGVPIIGWQHEIEGLSREDALAFYRAHYAPDHALVVVAGDVDPDTVQRLAQVFYGPLEPSGMAPAARPAEPPQRAERRLVMEDPRVAQPYIARSYLAPERDPGAQEKAAALTYLAALLGGDAATSVLGQALQFDSQTAVYSSAFYDGLSRDATTFNLVVVPAEGVSLEAAEAALDVALARFLDTGPDPVAFDSVKLRLRASEIYAQDSLRGQAQRYGAGLASGLGLADIEAWPEILQAVTPDDVMAMAREVLDRRRAVTGWLKAPEAAAAAEG